MARRQSLLVRDPVTVSGAVRAPRQALARAGTLALMCALLAGCADPTGDIDADGHNGYDADTCEQAKALALDIQYGTVYQGSEETRIKGLTHDAAKASHPDVRQAATALITGYAARNRQTVTAATASLVKACRM